MTEWAARRFWSDVSVRPEGQGWAVALDGRPVRTPAKRPLVLPTRALADAVAGEWEGQGERIDPLMMPVTRAANAAIDKVAPQREEVAEMLAAYAETDLLCYRAEAPDALVIRQSRAWDPLLAWAENDLGARLEPFAGVMPRPQDPAALERLAGLTGRLDAFALTGFHDLVTLSGSLVLAFAVILDRLDAGTAWETSRIDEAWQAEQWGLDAEAEAASERRREAFLAAARFHAMARDDGH